MSTDSEVAEQKKRSQEIDKKLEEDSRKLRRECKILLLGDQNEQQTIGGRANVP
jgi:guanine nucleotide-binding protein subunit alpha